MTGWVVRTFKGLAPRHSPRLLGDDMAQSCANLRLTKGTLTPLRANTAVAATLKTGTITSIHRFGQDVASDTQHWFNWTQDVDVVRGAIFDDTSERTYFTGAGTPRKTDSALALTGGTAYPMASLELGLPAPVGVMTAAVTGLPSHYDDQALADAAQATADADLLAAQADGPNAAVLAMGDDAVLAVTEKAAFAAEVDALGAGHAALSAYAEDYALATESAAYAAAAAALVTYVITLTTPYAWDNMGGDTTIVGATFKAKFNAVYDTRNALLFAVATVAQTRADTAQAVADAARATPETRVYTCTFVTSWDEESSPGLPSAEVNVGFGQTVNLTTIPAYPTGDYVFTSVRIYRSVTGSSDTSYYYVGETTTPALGFADTVAPDDLGEELPTLTFLPPPAGLTGLTAMPGGVMAGFVGKDVYFCEPYKPYAWPVGYSMTVDANIVGLGVFDTTLLVLTKSAPYLISGSEPANYSMIRAELPQACVSKRSIVDVGGGIVYASPDGLFLLGGGVTRNLTEQLFSRIEWQALNPSTIHAYVVDNSYVGFYGGTAGFIFNLQDGSFVPLDWYAQAGYYDPIRDALFLVTGTNSLVKFDSGAALTMHWKSKIFYTPKPINLGCARVEAASYPVTLKVWGDGVLKHTQTVTSKEVFRLPSQYLANLWEFEVSGSVEVYSAGFAEAVEEMAHG